MTTIYRAARRIQVRFNSTDAPKRLAANWDDIVIPSQNELKAQKESLSARLASRRPVRAAAPVPAAPVLIPVAPSPARKEPHKEPRKTTPRREPKPAPSVAPAPVNSLQAAADTFDDLFQIIPNQPPTKKSSGNKSQTRAKEAAKPSAPSTPFKGLRWTPDGGNQSTRPAPSPRTPRKRNSDVPSSRRHRDNSEDEGIILADEQLSEEELEKLEEASEYDPSIDPTVINGVSLLGPKPDQTTRLWYEDLVGQNREPQGPNFLTPDVEISSDMHSLFDIDRAQTQRRITSSLGALQARPAVKKGKVDYQIKKIMRKYGGAYSHIQPRLVPTDLGRMRPSQVALLAMSRRAEAGTYRRKKFETVLSSTLKGVDTVPRSSA